MTLFLPGTAATKGSEGNGDEHFQASRSEQTVQDRVEDFPSNHTALYSENVSTEKRE